MRRGAAHHTTARRKQRLIKILVIVVFVLFLLKAIVSDIRRGYIAQSWSSFKNRRTLELPEDHLSTQSKPALDVDALLRIERIKDGSSSFQLDESTAQEVQDDLDGDTGGDNNAEDVVHESAGAEEKEESEIDVESIDAKEDENVWAALKKSRLAEESTEVVIEDKPQRRSSARAIRENKTDAASQPPRPEDESDVYHDETIPHEGVDTLRAAAGGLDVSDETVSNGEEAKVEESPYWNDVPAEGPETLSSEESIMPYVQVHLEGCPDYLKMSMWQSRIYNRLVYNLVGEECKQFCIAQEQTCYDVASLELDQSVYEGLGSVECEGANELRRWFLVMNFMKRLGIRQAFVADADTLFYTSAGTVAEHFKGVELAVLWEPPLCSVAFGLFTVDGLSDFTSFISHYAHEVPIERQRCLTGADAMTLYIAAGIDKSSVDCLWDGTTGCSDRLPFQEAKSVGYSAAYVPESLSIPFGDGKQRMYFDFSMAENQFDMFKQVAPNAKEYDGVLKQVQWDDAVPYIQRSDWEKYVKVGGLHFEGNTTRFMKHFLRQRRYPTGRCLCRNIDCHLCKQYSHAEKVVKPSMWP